MDRAESLRMVRTYTRDTIESKYPTDAEDRERSIELVWVAAMKWCTEDHLEGLSFDCMPDLTCYIDLYRDGMSAGDAADICCERWAEDDSLFASIYYGEGE